MPLGCVAGADRGVCRWDHACGPDSEVAQWSGQAGTPERWEPCGAHTSAPYAPDSNAIPLVKCLFKIADPAESFFW